MSEPRESRISLITLAMAISSFIMGFAATWNDFSVENEGRLSTLEAEMKSAKEDIKELKEAGQ